MTAFNLALHHRRTASLSAAERREAFERLPEKQRAEAWDELRERIDVRRYLDGELEEFPVSKSRKAKPSRPPARSARPAAMRRRRSEVDDPLRLVPPPEYVRILCGVAVPSCGGTIRCPLPGHDDDTPSFRVWPDPERGVWCFGCHRGGDAYGFAGALWGVELRGLSFVLLRRHLARTLIEGGLR